MTKMILKLKILQEDQTRRFDVSATILICAKIRLNIKDIELTVE